MRKSVKPVGTNPGAMYGICKVHKQQVGGGPPISVNFIVLQTPTYNLSKFLVPILNPLAKNEDTVKDLSSSSSWSSSSSSSICWRDLWARPYIMYG